MPIDRDTIEPIPLGKRLIGPGCPVYIIAEIGINHEGDSESCARMVDAAASAGADAVKLQIVDAEKSYLPGTESYKIFKDSRLTDKEIERLYAYAKRLGIDMFATCGDADSLSGFAQLAPIAYKISSGLLTHAPLIEQTARTGKPLLMSTGMADEKTIERAIRNAREAGGEQIGLFHCTSIYPTPPEDLNLKTIPYLEETFHMPVGFSDHSKGIFAATLAVAAGACMLEKHFTLDPSRKGYDHHLSASPSELKRLVENVRLTERIMGKFGKTMSDAEFENARRFNRYVIAGCDMDANTVLTENNIGIMRLANGQIGLPAFQYPTLIGKRTNKFIAQYSPILLENLDDNHE